MIVASVTALLSIVASAVAFDASANNNIALYWVSHFRVCRMLCWMLGAHYCVVGGTYRVKDAPRYG
jgi:hypothetical protein